MIDSNVIYRMFAAPKIDRDAVLKYALCKDSDEQTISLMEECIAEASLAFHYRVAYIVLPVKCNGEELDLSFTRTRSEMLKKALDGCDSCILFGATVGMGIDRLVMKYSRKSPSKALMFQALGTERVETLCKVFVKEVRKELGIMTKRRVSPGYGDLSLDIQKEIFETLSCARYIGLTLNDSLVMSPSKSVTAFMGIKK